MSNVLIIDDDYQVTGMLARKVKDLGHQVDHATTLQDGLAKVAMSLVDVVLLDVVLPDGSGLDILPRLRTASGEPEVIVFTGAGDPEGAERAILHGAWDYIEKGSPLESMISTLSRALEYRKRREVQALPASFKRDGIIGESLQLRKSLELTARASESGANVLITGETGTGKELFAWCVHENSPRAAGNFVVVDCAALPESIVESVLFGHVRGAFTGADKDREGLILQADGGALFLDEVGELPLSLQKAFLRVLQAHRFRPVGAEREVESHFQLIAATNRDLDELVEVGHFRKDLLFRLRTTVIHLPPLRDRLEDIEGLSRHYLHQICDRRRIPSKAIGDDFLAALLTYRWPGNVRELIAVLERSLIVSEAAQTLHFQHLPQSLRICIRKSTIRQPLNAQVTDLPTDPPAPHFPTWEQVRCECEGRYLRDLLSFCEGDIQRACRASAISRSRLYALFRKHALLPRRTVSTR